MIAVLETGGKQYTVEEGQLLEVEKLEDAVGDKVVIDKVLLIGIDGETKIGSPYVDGASVEIEIVNQLRGGKVIVFKKRRRKDSKRKQGHRQYKTILKILKINA